MNVSEKIAQIKNTRNELSALKIEYRKCPCEDIKTRITLLEVCLECMCAEFKLLLERVERDDYRKLLHMRYIDGITWQKIAEEMYFEQRWIMRLKERAEENLKEVWENA